MDRSNHYEIAFESYLQHHGLCYVVVDETRRAVLGDLPLKSLDFIVFGRDGARLVVEVKGRRFPGGPPKRPRRVWECWSFREDVDGLERWSALVGEDYRGVLAFAYLLHPSVQLSDDTPDLYVCRGKRYLFRAIDVIDYRQHMRTRSPRWDTVTLPCAIFRSLVRPLRDFTRAKVVEEVPF